jgi:hypothetical protein
LSAAKISCATFLFGISTSLGIPFNSGAIELAKGADFTSCNLLVISKIAPDLLILLSKSLAKTFTMDSCTLLFLLLFDSELI